MNAIITYRKRFGLTPSQAVILEMLATGEAVTTHDIAKTICRGWPSDDSARVHVSRLRKQIVPIEIITSRAGYRIDEPHLSALRGLS